jgi:hypothetical protein
LKASHLKLVLAVIYDKTYCTIYIHHIGQCTRPNGPNAGCGERHETWNTMNMVGVGTEQ